MTTRAVHFQLALASLVLVCGWGAPLAGAREPGHPKIPIVASAPGPQLGLLKEAVLRVEKALSNSVTALN